MRQQALTAGMKMAGRGVRRAFTLFEVMIVIVIVLALGGLVAWNLMGTKEEADKGTVKIQMDSIGQALKDFRFVYSRYPTDEEGLKVLWDKTAMTDEEELKKWKKFLEKSVPKDKWGNEWGYRQKSDHGDPETEFDLWSYGKDKQEGTDDDIVSWDVNADASGNGGDGTTTKGNGG